MLLELPFLCKEKEFFEMDVIDEMKKLGLTPSQECLNSLN